MTAGWGVRILGSIVVVSVIAAVIAAIVILGPPSRQRQLKLDERRVQDLMNIQNTVESFWQRHGKLPPDIATLAREPGFGPAIMDPDRGSPYELEVRGADSYRLCAEFALDSEESPQTWTYVTPRRWAHGAGRQCFDLKIPQSIRDETRK